MTPPAHGEPRVALYGYFGLGNIGNEGSLEAFLQVLRSTHPDVPVECLAADPDAVSGEHGIPARRLMVYRPEPGATGLALLARKVGSRLWDVPHTVALVRDVDVLVVPGTGVLESRLIGGAWGLPYWLFLAALACRAHGGRVALVGVGAEPVAHPVTRALFHGTVRLTTHASFRDEASLRVAHRWGGRSGHHETCPDLAFALPVPTCRAERPGHVVIGVMAFQGAPTDPGRGPHRVRAYADAMTEVVTRLLDRGRTVHLVVGDVADRGLAHEIADRARAARFGTRGVTVSDAATLTALMEEMSEAEVVVASRFHNLICALKLAKPTVSLGYAGKNARLMEEFGLAGFDQALDSLDVDRLLEQVEEVRRVHAGVEVHMKETLRRLEAEVAAHLTRVVAALVDPSPVHRAGGRTRWSLRGRTRRGGHRR